MSINQGPNTPNQSDAPLASEITTAATNESVTSTDDLDPGTAIDETGGTAAASMSTPPAETQVSGCTVVAPVKLDASDHKLRENLNGDVINGKTAFMAMCGAVHKLATHKNGALFKELGYETIEDYARAELLVERTTIQRLLKMGRFLADLAKISAPDGAEGFRKVKMPMTEAQVRALDFVPEENRIDCWVNIVAALEPEDLTGPLVKEVAKGYLRRKKLKPSPKSTAGQMPDSKRAKKKIAELGKILGTLSTPEKFEPLIELLDHLVSSGNLDDVPLEDDISSSVDEDEAGQISPHIKGLIVGRMPFRELYLLHIRNRGASATTKRVQAESELSAPAMA